MRYRPAALFTLFTFSGTLLVLAGLLFYAVYRSPGYPPATMNKVYLALMAGLVLCGLAFRLPETYKQAAALTLLSVVAAVYLVEVFLACCTVLPDAVSLRAAAARAAGVPFDTRTRYEVFADLRQQGQAAYPSLNAAQLAGQTGLPAEQGELLPLAGIANQWTLHCNESGAYTFYQSDEHGFNNPPNAHRPSEIVLIGDSFTHGNCVPPGSDIGGQLRRWRPGAVNLGYSGNGPLLELATLKEYGLRLEPDTVLWLYHEGNDLQDLRVEQQSPMLAAYLDEGFSQRLAERQAEIDRALRAYIEARAAELDAAEPGGWMDTPAARILRLYHLRERAQFVLRALQSPPPPPLFADVLREARDATLASGARFYLVYVPGWRRYTPSADTGALYHRDEVLAIARSLDIPVIDLHPVFLQQPDPLAYFPFRLEGHYTAEGYALAAGAIHAYLEADGLAPACAALETCGTRTTASSRTCSASRASTSRTSTRIGLTPGAITAAGTRPRRSATSITPTSPPAFST